MQDWLTVHEGSAPLVIGLPHTGTDIPAAIEARIAARIEAKKAKNFAEADRIRAELLAEGVALEDTPQGTIWRRA